MTKHFKRGRIIEKAEKAFIKENKND